MQAVFHGYFWLLQEYVLLLVLPMKLGYSLGLHTQGGLSRQEFLQYGWESLSNKKA